MVKVRKYKRRDGTKVVSHTRSDVESDLKFKAGDKVKKKSVGKKKDSSLKDMAKKEQKPKEKVVDEAYFHDALAKYEEEFMYDEIGERVDLVEGYGSQKSAVEAIRDEGDELEDNFLKKMQSEGRLDKDLKDPSFWYNASDIDGWEDVFGDNSYNWGYLGVPDWNIRVYHDTINDEFWGILEPHLGGDVRGNYGEAIMFKEDDKDSAVIRVRELLSGTTTAIFTFKDGSRAEFYGEQDSDISYYADGEAYGGGVAQEFVEKVNSIEQGFERDEYIHKVGEGY